MKYIIGNKQEFLNFFNSISEKDKVGILTHTDLDGISSAIFLEEILNSKNIEVKFIDFLNYKKGMFDSIFSELREKKITKLFLTDLSADGTDLDNFERLRMEFDVFLIDHHPVNPLLKDKRNIIKTPSSDCTALTIYRMGSDIKNLRKFSWLVCAAIVAEVSYNNEGNLKFIQEFYPGITLGNIRDSVPGEIAKKVSSSIIYYRGDLKKVYDIVKMEKLEELNKAHEIIEVEIEKEMDKFKKEAEFFPEKKLYFYYSSPEFNIASVISSILSFKNPDKTIIFASDTEGGFVKLSARNQSGEVDLNTLLKKSVEGLENAVAGGHRKAAGGSLMKKDLEAFKENILRNINFN